MRQVLILLILTSMWVSVQAQVTTQQLGSGDMFADGSNSSAYGKVTLTQDRSLDGLADRYYHYQTARKGFPGWRVHLFFGTGYGAQQNADNVKKQFEAKFPDIPVYVVYEAPYFRVRVGDFRLNEKNKAYALKKNIEALFPSSWIVPDQINFPRL